MPPLPLIIVYCLFIVAASLFGGWLPTRVRVTHNLMQLTISFVGGLMLGIALFHLLPHAAGEYISLDRAAWWTMIGLLTMFFLIRAFHFHQHGVAEQPAGETAHVHATHDHAEATNPYDSPETHPHSHAGREHHVHGPHKLDWLGMTFGLALHTAIDGIALAASVMATATDDSSVRLAGFGTFLAVLLHKPLDSLSITSLMAAGGRSQRACQLVNAAYATMCPLGALAFYFGLAQPGPTQQTVVGCALAFAAGVFLCISLGDLLPELSFHTHDRFKLSAALLLGVLLAYVVGFLEPAHLHHGDEHRHSPNETGLQTENHA